MTNPKISIHDAITGELIEREMTDQEAADFAAKQLEKDNARLQKETEKLAAKAAAQAKLAALGLTPDDLKALGLGAN
jgi:TorA maturation chaperone TorD